MMGRRAAIASLIALAALVAGGWVLRTPTASETEASQITAAIADGQQLYAGYCASCHGRNLEGQPNWRSPGPDGRLRAPPHDETGHTWHHPDSVLFQYTQLGGRGALALQGVDYDSDMPAFGETLTDQEIRNVLAYIKSTWPERVQAIQAERTATDLEYGGN